MTLTVWACKACAFEVTVTSPHPTATKPASCGKCGSNAGFVEKQP